MRAEPCTGELVSVDLRPVNFDSAQRDTLRVGFDFSKPLKSRRPSQALLDQMRAHSASAPRAAGQASAPGGRRGAAPSAEGGSARPKAVATGGGGFGGRGGGGGGGGGGFGGGSRGRLTFSLTDTITFVDKVTIAPGAAELDYLHGDAAGSSGGTPRHLVEAQAGWFNNGLGARLSANWRSGTTVDRLTGDDLHFSPLATFDLRLFANPGDIPTGRQAPVAARHPGAAQRHNIFDAKPKVRDAAGDVPPSYQPDLLDPLGRTIRITIRKLFLAAAELLPPADPGTAAAAAIDNSPDG